MTLASLTTRNFSRGLDLSQSPIAVPDGFTPGAHNVELSPDGSVSSIRGYETTFREWPADDADGDITDLYTVNLGTLGSAHLKTILLANSDNYIYYTEINASTDDEIWTDTYNVDPPPTGNLRAVLIDDDSGDALELNDVTEGTYASYGEKIYFGSKENRMQSLLGFNATELVAGEDTGPPTGIILGIWNDIMWVADDSHPMTVVFSDVANFESTGSWPADNTITLGSSENDDIIGGVVTGDGLVVFTRTSTYLIYDPENGLYSVVDSHRGCFARRSLQMIDGKIYGVNQDGIFVTDGHTPLQIISERVEPLFQDEQPDLSTACAGVCQGHYYLTYERTTGHRFTIDVATRNDYAVLTNEYPAVCYATWSWKPDTITNDETEEVTNYGIDLGPERLMMVPSESPQVVAEALVGGTFDGSSFDFYYDLPASPLGDPTHMKRLRKIRILGRGLMTTEVRVDFVDVVVFTKNLTFANTSSGVWDEGNWDEAGSDDYGIGDDWCTVNAPRGRYFLVRFKGTSSGDDYLHTVIDGPGANAPTLATGAATVGAASLYEAEMFFVPTGRLRR